MAAMMLSSIAPLATLYERTVTTHRGPRLTALGSGYLLAWGAAGVVAFAIADVFGDMAADRPTLAQWVAVAGFAAAGLYQLTPLKMRCLDHGRSPLGTRYPGRCTSRPVLFGLLLGSHAGDGRFWRNERGCNGWSGTGHSS